MITADQGATGPDDIFQGLIKVDPPRTWPIRTPVPEPGRARAPAPRHRPLAAVPVGRCRRGWVQLAVQVSVGAVLAPVRVPWKPKEALPPAATEPL
ncbi:hypothetical protein GCM10009759_10110 [Kitasatospora saccharophila]|uniref:Uncharacterized protein n=1 Tax=Kitasatospora saccharophila TaxID=407973 RepID=A0ABN2WB28_9ACTN